MSNGRARRVECTRKHGLTCTLSNDPSGSAQCGWDDQIACDAIGFDKWADFDEEMLLEACAVLLENCADKDIDTGSTSMGTTSDSGETEGASSTGGDGTTSGVPGTDGGAKSSSGTGASGPSTTSSDTDGSPSSGAGSEGDDEDPSNCSVGATGGPGSVVMALFLLGLRPRRDRYRGVR